MTGNRYRINFNLSSLLMDSKFELHRDSQASVGDKVEGLKSALEEFINHYGFLPLSNADFIRVTSLGSLVAMETAPEIVELSKNLKGQIVEVITEHEDSLKFFAVDTGTYKPIDAIEQLMWGMRELGNTVKPYEVVVRGSCDLSQAISYLIIESNFFNDPIAQWQNGEYDTPHIQEPIRETVGIILTNPIINNTDTPMKVYEEVTRNSDNAVETLNSLVGKLASRSVCPMGVVTIDSDTEWARQLKKLIDTEGSVNLGLGAVRGHLVEVTNIENKRTQTFFVRGDTRQEAGRNLKEYLLVRIGDYNPTLYQKNYKEFTDSTIIAKHILMAINNNNSIDTTEKSKGISTDFMKKD